MRGLILKRKEACNRIPPLMTNTNHNLIYSTVSTTKACSIPLQVKLEVLDKTTHFYEAPLNLYQYYR